MKKFIKIPIILLFLSSFLTRVIAEEVLTWQDCIKEAQKNHPDLISIFAGWAVKVSLSSIILATTFSLIVGVVFGLWPAQKASKLDPIEALRYE